MKNLSDDRLLTLFEQGVNEAFDELLNRYKEKLYTYIYVLVQNREMAEDIFQDTFTRVIVTIKQKRYNEKGRFQGFLYRVARNLIGTLLTILRGRNIRKANHGGSSQAYRIPS